MLWIGNACAPRGFNALVFEGPGQVGAVDLNPGLCVPARLRGARAPRDHYVIGRPDVDPGRLAILGYSVRRLPRASRRRGDPRRIRAVVANTLGVDIPGAFRMALPAMLWTLPPDALDAAFGALTHASVTAPFSLESAKDAFGTQSGSEFLKVLEPCSNLWSVQGALTVPLLVMITEDEIAEAPKQLVRDTLEFSAGLTGPVCVPRLHARGRRDRALPARLARAHAARALPVARTRARRWRAIRGSRARGRRVLRATRAAD